MRASPPDLGQHSAPLIVTRGGDPNTPSSSPSPAAWGAAPAQGGGVGHKVAAQRELIRRRRRPAPPGRDLAWVLALGLSGRSREVAAGGGLPRVGRGPGRGSQAGEPFSAEPAARDQRRLLSSLSSLGKPREESALSLAGRELQSIAGRGRGEEKTEGAA